jgi:hypothetical protein
VRERERERQTDRETEGKLRVNVHGKMFLNRMCSFIPVQVLGSSEIGLQNRKHLGFKWKTTCVLPASGPS